MCRNTGVQGVGLSTVILNPVSHKGCVKMLKRWLGREGLAAKEAALGELRAV